MHLITAQEVRGLSPLEVTSKQRGSRNVSPFLFPDLLQNRLFLLSPISIILIFLNKKPSGLTEGSFFFNQIVWICSLLIQLKTKPPSWMRGLE